MKIIIEKNYEVLSETTARILLGEMYQDKRVNISITAGASPVGTYEIVTKVIADNVDIYDNVHFYNFDEVQLKGQEIGLTMGGLTKQFFAPANIKSDNIHPLTMNNYLEKEAEVEAAGGFDLMLIGLGQDGHFCGNMPYAVQFDKTIYKIKLEDKYPWYQMMKASFKEQEIPEEMVTMGAAMLMKVKRLVLIVNGKSKAEAVARLLHDDISPEFPASILRLHPNLTIILDADAASALPC